MASYMTFAKGDLEIEMEYRPGTTDENALKEVTERRCYRRKTADFDVERGEHWLDLGANIGSFAAYVFLNGGTASCYEPDSENFEMLKRNVGTLSGFKLYHSAVTNIKKTKLRFFKGKKPTDHYRGTIIPNTTSHPENMLPNMHVNSMWRLKFDGIKMDIEGSEFGILDDHLISRKAKYKLWAPKLVIEYHFSKNRELIHFRRRMDYLRSIYSQVIYAPGLDRGYPGDIFPGFFDRLVWCIL